MLLPSANILMRFFLPAGTALLVLLLPAFTSMAGTPVKGGGESSFPALSSLQNLLLKHEKEYGLIPVTLRDKRKIPRDWVASKEELARLVFGEYLIETGMSRQAAGILEKLIGTREQGSFIRMAREALQRAYYQNGNHKKSLEVFYQISSEVSWDPDPGILLMAGNSNLQRGDFRPALDTLGRLSPDRTTYPFGLYSMGLALLELEGEEPDRLWPLIKLVRLSPGDDPVLMELVNRGRLTLALLLKNQDKLSEALALLEQINPESGAYSGGLYGAGIVLAESGSCVRAIVVFESLREKFSTTPYGLEALFRIGACFSDLKAFRNAVDRFHEALRRLQEEKTHLAGFRSKIRTGERVSIPDIQSRFPPGPGVTREVFGQSWAKRFKEMIRLETRVERLGERIRNNGEDKKGEAVQLRSEVREARKELESAYLAAVSGEISKRIRWIEDLTQQTTLQLARHIILIQDYEAIP